MLSPLAPSVFASLPPIAGVRLAAGKCGIRHKDRLDVMLAELAEGTAVAGVFTTSLTTSAAVDFCRANLAGGAARGLIVNSGNANAFTGKAGEHAAARIAHAMAATLGCADTHVFMASTGVIGEALPGEKITAVLPFLSDSLSGDAWEDAARAIMTTDTFPKMVTRKTAIGGVPVTLNGIAKGSGMIAPDMATMLGFLFTDANIPAPVLQTLLTGANAKTFNCITVDGDTSTSDTLLLFATRLAPHPTVTRAEEALLAPFREALHSLMLELAQLIVRDGEGAEKFVTIAVTGAESDKAARRIGMSIANSPLVKTALAAGDANWGRIVAAVGKAGERADRDKLSITIGGALVAKNGSVAPQYQENQVAAHMKSRNILIEVDVGVGGGRAEIWTCDLTHRYIDINGSYRT